MCINIKIGFTGQTLLSYLTILLPFYDNYEYDLCSI